MPESVAEPADAGLHPRVAVVVVTFNNLADTRRCLASLLSSDYPNSEIIVVDNGSQAREDLPLGEEFGSRITAIRVEVNRGYATGANAGLRVALSRSPRYVWLLNNDTVVEPGTLATLVAAMESDRRVGISAPVILGSDTEDWSEDVWYAGGEILLGRGRTAHHSTIAAPSGALIARTGFVTGSAMFVRTEVFASVGLLDESLFLFYEDADFNIRALRSGWTLGVVPSARVRHQVHGTIGKGWWAYLMTRNGRVMTGRYGSPAQLAELVLRTTARSAVLAPRALRGDRDARDAIRGSAVGLYLMARNAVGRAATALAASRSSRISPC